MNEASERPTLDYLDLTEKIKRWGKELGFNQVGICDIDLSIHEDRLTQWLDNQYHGEMDYMARHGMKRARPGELEPGTVRVISARMDYLPEDAHFARTLEDPDLAYISRYALGRDYHKLIRKRLKKLGDRIKAYCELLQFRPFVDSAPVLERPLADKAGLGWTGKHSLLLNEEAGSWFFLGELLVNIPLPVDAPVSDQCGTCTSCLKICPTQAIVEPYVVDSRRCISYLTIELKSAIPDEFRSLIGNRIYGCDDCQLVCPWNRYAKLSVEKDFSIREQFKSAELTTLFQWSEEEFLTFTEGSAIRRIGYQQWQRNIAVALGNSNYSDEIVSLLKQKREASSIMVTEHIDWAISEQLNKRDGLTNIEQQKVTDKLVRAIDISLPRDA